MSNQPYTAPEYKKTAYNCPYCGAYAQQHWCDYYFRTVNGFAEDKDLEFCVCRHCSGKSIWHKNVILVPDSSTAPPPHPDLPVEVRADFEEARSILTRSPRGAAALFRLCVQKLCGQIGGKGKNINDDIATLVKQGLDPKIQKSLDYVRVIGANAVHPLEIDLNDTPEIANMLPILINTIVELTISRQKLIEGAYNRLPQSSRDAIKDRDNKPAN